MSPKFCALITTNKSQTENFLLYYIKQKPFFLEFPSNKNKFSLFSHQKLTVEAPKGSVIGFVRQAWSCFHPKYMIKNAEDQTVLKIKGPCCRCNICGDIEFEVANLTNCVKIFFKLFFRK